MSQQNTQPETTPSNEQAWQESFAAGDETPIREAAGAMHGNVNTPGDTLDAPRPPGDEPAGGDWHPGTPYDEHGHGDVDASADESRQG